METNIAIIQILALLTPTLPPNKFDERDVKAFEAFLAQSSALSSSTEWISAAMLVLFCASKSDATGVADFLRTSTIPEATLQNLFLTGVSDSETKFQTNARWEMCGKWLASKGESMHAHFQENGWSKKLLEYGLVGSDSDVYLKVVKDLLSCEPHLWYGQLVKDGHLEALVRIMRACDDDKNSDWMACFSFIALWRWYQHEATKCATDEVPPFLDHDIVDGVVHYFISSQRGITEWNVQHFGSHLDDIIIFRDLVLSGSTFLQTAASLGLTPEDQAQALSDGYKRWVSLIMDYLSRIKTAKEDFQLWRWANGHDGLFLTLDHALNGSDGTMQDIGDGALSHNIATLSSVTYVIRCAWSGGLLHCSNDSDHLVVNYKDLGTPEQKWKLIRTSPTAFMLQNVATKTYLSYLKSLPDAPRQLGDGTQYITSVGVAPDRGAHLCCHEIPSEWEFKKAESSDEVRLALHNFPNLMVILWGDYAYDGSSMQLWGFEDKDAQLFTFEEVTS
ncbi:hypothetical protein FRC02_008460 [Tulasnella sp. 418]|nr:hypothetical protein FRC02_008460 [Tulasnella sp. 418]